VESKTNKQLASAVNNILKKIVIHTGMVYLAWLAAFILAMILILIVPGAGQIASPIGRLLDSPYCLPDVACAAVLGWLAQRRLSIAGAAYGIILPAALLVADVVIEGLPMQKYTSLVDIYFSSNSGDTEGLYKLFLTDPLYCAVSYAFGALASTFVRRREGNLSPDASII
jgi:hypothetical protein